MTTRTPPDLSGSELSTLLDLHRRVRLDQLSALQLLAGQGLGSADNLPPGSFSRLQREARDELAEITAAARRVRSGVHGRCESCGGSLPAAQLLAEPWARRCRGCGP
jgi:hypothetical protein